MTAKMIAEKLALSSRYVEKKIKLLREAGEIQHVGSTKNGYWKIFK